MTIAHRIATIAAALLIGAAVVSAQTPVPAAPDPAADTLKQAQDQIRQGHLDQATAMLRQGVATYPASFGAHLRLGTALDLAGQYGEARTALRKAIDLAGTPAERVQATRALAISYGFENDCASVVKYQNPLYDAYFAAKDMYMAGEIANELARLCLEAGQFDIAEDWYRRGYAAGLQEPGITPARKDLWEFRWQNALARVAARRGRKDEAQKHVALAKVALDTGTNPDQAPFWPYLTGYVAFYAADYKTAVAELQQGNQNDPFVLVLIAQSLEKLGDAEQARSYYQKVLATTIHNPTAAYARPIARKKLDVR